VRISLPEGGVNDRNCNDIPQSLQQSEFPGKSRAHAEFRDTRRVEYKQSGKIESGEKLKYKCYTESLT